MIAHNGLVNSAVAEVSRLMLKLGVIDGVVPEPMGGAHKDHPAAAGALKTALLAALGEIQRVPIKKLLDLRYQKFRAMGVFGEE